MITEPEVIGDWIKERTLGYGGFGVVNLWKNTKNYDQFAIKKYREESTKNLTEKQRERWTQEVDMMKRIKNDNIISFRQLPPDLEHELNRYNLSKLPMLSMEYCSKGDLRSVLVKSENSCGLPESDVRYILSDLKNAISYLHSLKITHRDLKPENIVLQTSDRPNNIIYKLIDLGYAKELDTKSLAASFVGTLQYLAPELMYSKTYSCSVDYWSMGLVAFEVMCGTRPFLPNMSPAQWMFHVHKKTSDIICIYQQTELTTSTISSPEIFSECHVSRCFKQYIEKWLQLALEYAPRKRGYLNYNPNNPENELAIFTSLDELLAKKIITVFLVHSCEFLSYEIDDCTQVTTVQTWIERDTKLPENDQFLISSLCESIDPNGLAVQFFDQSYRTTMLYVFKKSDILCKELRVKKCPQLVKDMLDDSTTELNYYFQKRSYAHALYFIYKETEIYNSILDACALRIESMLKLCNVTNETCKKMHENIEKLISQKDFSQELLNFDCKQYLKNYSQNATHWQDSFNTVVDKINKLDGVCKQISVRFESAGKRAFILKNTFKNSFSRFNSHDLNELLDSALICYDEVRKRSKEERVKPESCINMLKIVYNVLKSRDKLLRDTKFRESLQQIVDVNLQWDKILPTITAAMDHVEKFTKDLLTDNIARQTKIWEFTIKQKVNPKSPLLEPKPTNFILGNPSIPYEDIGSPISLSKPLHFILGNAQKSLETNTAKIDPKPIQNSINNVINSEIDCPKDIKIENERIEKNSTQSEIKNTQNQNVIIPNVTDQKILETKKQNTEKNYELKYAPKLEEVVQNNKIIQEEHIYVNTHKNGELLKNGNTKQQNDDFNTNHQFQNNIIPKLPKTEITLPNPQTIDDLNCILNSQKLEESVLKNSKPQKLVDNSLILKDLNWVPPNFEEKLSKNEPSLQEFISNVQKIKENLKINPKPNPPKEITLNENLNRPNFIIGAPASVIINDNRSLLNELEERTNESFIKYKSILNDSLDFGFLNE